MEFFIKPMNPIYAKEIVKWHYEDPYSVYDFEDEPEVVQELLNGSFFAATMEDDRLAGFFCFGEAARVPGGYCLGLYGGSSVIDIGLGCKPSLTGQGHGLDFVNAGLDYARKKFAPKSFRLSVATFNQRAIRVYEKAGFKAGPIFMSRTPNGEREFMLMTADV